MKPDTVVFIAIGLLAVMAVGIVIGAATLVVEAATKLTEIFTQTLNP